MTKIKRIEYRCVRNPEGTHLKGFVAGRNYQGRSFNGLFEITTEWASHQPTYLIDRKDFEKYFELVEQQVKEKAEV